jgi:hypothetical protein
MRISISVRILSKVDLPSPVWEASYNLLRVSIEQQGEGKVNSLSLSFWTSICFQALTAKILVLGPLDIGIYISILPHYPGS